MNAVAATLEHIRSKKQGDRFDNFGKIVASLLRDIPDPKLASETMLKIQQLLHDTMYRTSEPLPTTQQPSASSASQETMTELTPVDSYSISFPLAHYYEQD